MNKTVLYFWKPLLWAFVITTLSLLPDKNFDRVPLIPIPHFDKFVHFAMYTGLSLLLYESLKKNIAKNKIAAIYSILFSIIYGIIMEVLQFEMQLGRHFELLDFIANSLGAIAGVFLFPVYDKLIQLFFRRYR